MKYRMVYLAGYSPVEDILDEIEETNGIYYGKGTFEIVGRTVAFKIQIPKRDVLEIEIL